MKKGHKNDEILPDFFKNKTGDIDNYSINLRIGRGKYSTVFAGHQCYTKVPVVIKVLKPVRIDKVNREIGILEILKGGPNVSQLLDIVKDPDAGTISLILNYSENNDIKHLFGKMTSDDVTTYVYGVLKALNYAHSKGIMHRDVKPGNIMWDNEKKKVTLIDWGLAEFYNPGQDYQVRVATKNYKGPELLLGYQKYTPKLDVWCLGCTFASLLFHRVPFFKGKDNNEQIEKMCVYLGGEDMIKFAEKYGLKIPSSVLTKISSYEKNLWTSLVNEENQDICTPEALDLLTKMLKIDPELRISTEEALQHPYFDNIRKK